MATEKRLIDANELKEFLENVRQNYLEEDTFSCDFAADIIETVQDEYISLVTTVDAVEVVRCKDCKFWHEETGWCQHHSHFIGSEGEFCHPWESNDWKMLDAEDFCSYGERKDND